MQMKYTDAMEYAKRVAARPMVAEGDPDEACIVALLSALEVMNEAEANTQQCLQRMSAGWESSDRRASWGESMLRREEKLRAMAEAELAEVKTQMAKDSKGGALQSILYMAEAERADQAEKKCEELKAMLDATQVEREAMSRANQKLAEELKALKEKL